MLEFQELELHVGFQLLIPQSSSEDGGGGGSRFHTSLANKS